MAIKLEIPKADLTFEAGYLQPDFGLLKEGSAVIEHLYRRLEPHGLRLTDLRVERFTSNLGDHQIVCNMFNFWMTVKIRIDRIEIVCSELPRDYVGKVKAVILDAVKALNDYNPKLSFRAFAIVVGLHAKLEGHTVRDYLARFVANAPQKLGPSTGSGAVFYFGPEGDRLLSSVTADVSVIVQEAVWLRIHGVWDARKVTPDSLSELADNLVRDALGSLGLQLAV